MPEWLKSFLKVIGIFFSLVAIGGVITYLVLIILVPEENTDTPEVVGKTLEEAVISLSKSGLGIKIVGKKFSQEIPAGVILSQIPPPGTRVRKNRIVEVVVSEGARLVTCPSVRGMKLREARISLSQIGVEIKNVSYVYSPKFNRDEVIAQDPPEETQINREDGVNLLVSLGPPKMYFFLPDFRGKNVEEVIKWLEGVPLNIAKIKEEPSEKEEGEVLSQLPPPGSRVEENSEIELMVSVSPSRKEEILLPQQKWVITSVEIPPGFEEKRVYLVVLDEEGKKIVDYGMHLPGERVWISSEVMGKGEMRIYVDDELIKLKKVQ